MELWNNTKGTRVCLTYAKGPATKTSQLTRTHLPPLSSLLLGHLLDLSGQYQATTPELLLN